MDDRVKLLIGLYQSSEQSIRHHVEGLSNEQSFLQPQFEAISFNWTLGHIVDCRAGALRAMGKTYAWEGGKIPMYGRGPSGTTVPGDGRALVDLMADLDETGRLLEEALSGASAEVLDGIIQTFFGDRSRFDFVSQMAWHETYHVGQLGLLRSLAPSGRATS